MDAQTTTGEGEVAFLSAKRWDRRNRADLIESATPCHDAQVVGALLGLEPTPFDCSGCNVRGLHHGATTHRLSYQNRKICFPLFHVRK